MHLNHKPKVKIWLCQSLSAWSVIFIIGALSSINVGASQWSVSQFSPLAPVLFYNAGGTGLPGIPGLIFTPYPQDIGGASPANFVSAGLAPGALENSSGPGGYSYLDITFNPPVQAVGAYPFPLDASYNTITETVYDQNTNAIESGSVEVFLYGSPVFLGFGETTTNIYKVEWRYSSPGFIGVANIIYQPGPSMVISNATLSNSIAGGHTNLIQTTSNPGSGNWTTLSNLTLFGDEQVKKVTILMTNGPTGYFRVQAH